MAFVGELLGIRLTFSFNPTARLKCKCSSTMKSTRARSAQQRHYTGKARNYSLSAHTKREKASFEPALNSSRRDQKIIPKAATGSPTL